MSLNWYGNQSTAEGCHFGSLAVIVPLLEQMKIADIINQHLAVDPQADFDHGTVLSLLVAARLHSPVALSNVATWADDCGADILWDMPIEKINDDRLGRSLDAFFDQRHSILASLALQVSRRFDVPLSSLHYDPTHILFEGAYEDAQPRTSVVHGETIRSDDALDPAHITKGRRIDDAPKGARMTHAGLCTHVDEFGPLPLFGHTVDGNQNGRTAVHEQFALITKHLRPTELTMISDRGTFSVGHLLRLSDEGYHAICSAPWNDFRPLFDEQFERLLWKEASYLSMEQERRRESGSDLPQEHYELAVLRHRLKDDASGRELRCRVIFVYSTADEKVVREQRQKQINKLREGLQKIEQSVAAGRRSTDEKSVLRRVTRLFGTKQAARYFSWEMQPLTKSQRSKLPKPARGCRRPTHRFVWSFDESLLAEDEQYDGYAVLVTTVPPSCSSADALFTRFKQQNYVEHVNARFKGPLAVRPVYLHSPRRVESLVFLMMIALTVYFLLQRLYRQAVPADAPQKEHRTTTQTILAAFTKYTLLIHRTRIGRVIYPTRLTARQREILNRLGFSTPPHILSHHLPRAPD
jgi:transposase